MKVEQSAHGSCGDPFESDWKPWSVNVLALSGRGDRVAIYVCEYIRGASVFAMMIGLSVLI